MKKLLKKQKGFTLVELLVVIAILGILATVSVVGYTTYIKSARESNAKTELTEFRDMLIAEDINNDHFTIGDTKIEFAANGEYDYAATSDTAIDANKTYYTRSGAVAPYTYTEVEEPSASNIGVYYEKVTLYYTFEDVLEDMKENLPHFYTETTTSSGSTSITNTSWKLSLSADNKTVTYDYGSNDVMAYWTIGSDITNKQAA